MANFEDLEWRADRVLLHGLVFRNHYVKNDAEWDLGDRCIPLIKTKLLIDGYRRFFASKPGFAPRYIFEIGMFSAGSIAFWYEVFRPEKIVGVDINPSKENEYFKRYIEREGLDERIRPYWNTDQSDAAKLRRIVREELPHGIDLVFDDASHLYEPTKRSFETLFPLLRPGGLYIVEDWSWAHTEAYQRKDSPWRDRIALTQLIFELAEAVGSTRHITGLYVFDGFAVVEKGGLPLDPQQEFRLEHIIRRREG